jgi:hypothetical protein
MSPVERKDGKLLLVREGVELEVATAEPEVVEPQAPSERQTSTKPDDVGWDEWRRRGNAVRTMAREMDDLDHGDIREFIQGHLSRELTDEEVGQLKHDVMAHRVGDITDILDDQLRSASDRLKRARRTVTVKAPRGWMTKAFNGLDERAVGQVAARLLERGHDPEAISAKVFSRVKDEETRSRLEEALVGQKLKVEFAGADWVTDYDDDTELTPDLILERIGVLMDIYNHFGQKE